MAKTAAQKQRSTRSHKTKAETRTELSGRCGRGREDRRSAGRHLQPHRHRDRPGRGVLTDLLIPRAKRVIGIELDRVLAAQLRMRYATRPNVEMLESDFVTAEFPSMVGRRPGPLHDLRPTQAETVDVVGNLPYYITSDIVLRILELHHNIERAVIMVQREVADRIAAAARAAATTDCSRRPRNCSRGSTSCSPCRREPFLRRRKCTPACCG